MPALPRPIHHGIPSFMYHDWAFNVCLTGDAYRASYSQPIELLQCARHGLLMLSRSRGPTFPVRVILSQRLRPLGLMASPW